MRLIRFLLALIILLFDCSELDAQTYIPAGDVGGAWDVTGSPYLIEGNINIPIDSQLFIGPGTEVLFLGPYQMRIYGYLNASGSESDSIYFSSPDSVDSWLGLRLIDFVQILPDSIRISYCSFTKAKKNHPDSLGGAFYAKNSPRVSIDNSRFSNCYAGSGGSIYLKNSSILVRDTEIRNNEAGRGGAMYIHQSSPELINLDIKNNMGGVAGGIYYYNSNGLISSSLVESNTSQGGGGGIVLHKTSNVHMHNCHISYNIAHGSGGGIALLEGSMPLIEYCHISYNQTIFDQYIAKGGGIFITQHGNNALIENTLIGYNISADDGGGIYTESETSIISSLFIHNEANADQGFGGGAVYALYQKCLILNCTFASNIASQGTCIYATGASLDIFNSIIWDFGITEEKKIYMHNFLIDPVIKIDHTDLEGGENQIGGSGTFQLFWGENNIDEAPEFSDPWQDLYTLEDNSPCINTGLLDTLTFLLPMKDLAMNPRVYGPTVDMGAYENQSPVFIREEAGKDKLISRVYPVPARDHINIELSERISQNTLTFEIISIGGQVIKSKRVSNPMNHLRVRLNNLPSGLYVLRVSDMTEQESLMFNVIK